MDDALLVEQVERFSLLYDKSHPNFKKKIQRENAWSTLGVILSETPKACEQRWGVLRNKYNQLKREFKFPPSGCGAEATRINWPLFEPMKFLEPFVVTRQTRTSYKKVVSKKCSSQTVQTPSVLHLMPAVPGPSTSSATSLSRAWETMNEILGPEADYSSQSEDFEALHSHEESGEGEIVMEQHEHSDFDKTGGETPSSKPLRRPLSASSSSNQTPNKRRYAPKQSETEEGDKIVGAFESFSKYLTTMSNQTQTPVAPQQNEEYLFGQQVAQDLGQIRSIEDRMKIKSEIYNIFHDYFKNKSN